MPLFVVEHPIIVLNPNCTATKKVPNLNLFGKLLNDYFPKEIFFPPIEMIIFAGSTPHNSCMTKEAHYHGTLWA
jgi:hypothetical protein